MNIVTSIVARRDAGSVRGRAKDAWMSNYVDTSERSPILER
jgi:hypothetical protein